MSVSLTSMRACVRACVILYVRARARACLRVCAPCRMVAADKPLPGRTAKAKSSTTSGAFFAESLSATRGGGQMNPGAMLQTSIKQPGPRAATIMPGSPTSRHATSRMSLRGPSDSPLPATSPRRLARQDGRSGTVVIWGDGWARSASPAKPREGPVTVYTPTKVPVANAFDATMHPLVSESEDLSATPRPERDAAQGVGFAKPREDQEFVGHKMLSVCGGFGKLALITQDGAVVQSGDEADEGASPMQVVAPRPAVPARGAPRARQCRGAALAAATRLPSVSGRGFRQG